MKTWIMLFLCGLLLTAGCATSSVQSEASSQQQTTDILASELDSIDQRFAKSHAELMTQVKSLPKSSTSSEVLRHAMALDRHHETYVELSKRLAEQLEESRNATSQNN